MGQTLRKKIFIAYAVPIVCSLVLLAGIFYGFVHRSIDADQQEKLVILASDYAHRIEGHLRNRMEVLERVETLDFKNNFRELALAGHLAKFSQSLPVLSYLNEVGQEEVRVVKGEKSPLLLDYGVDPRFAEAVGRRNMIVFGGVAVSPELREPCLTLWLARFGYFGDEFQGVLKAEIPLPDLTRDLPGLKLGRSGYAILVDGDGRVLYHPDPLLLLKPLPGDAALRALIGEEGGSSSGTSLVEIDGGKALAARAVVTPLRWSVLTVLPYAEFIEPSTRLAWYGLGTALLALALGLLLARRIAQPLSRNLTKVIRHTALIAAGQMKETLEIRSGDELETVADSLNQMSLKISQALGARDAVQSILQSIIDPLILFDREMRILRVNTAALQLLNRELKDLVGSPIVDLLAGSSAEAEEFLSEILRRGMLQDHETLLRISAGSSVPVLLSCAVPDPSMNAEVGLVAIFKDLSYRLQAEEGRRRALAFTEALLAQSPVGIRVFDGVSGDCVRVNQAAAEIAGGSMEKLLAQNFRDLESWRATSLVETAERVLADGEDRLVEMDLATSFGRHLQGRYHLSRFLVEGRPHLLVLGQDVTEEKHLEEENRRIEEQMLHVQKLESLGVLAGGIAHDFNNILMAILGNTDLALMRLPAESPAVSYLQQIGKAAGKAADLASQMLAYSGKGKFVVENLDLNRVIEEMVHMLEVSISKKALLRFNFSRHLPAVEGDATQLRQVIMNLVINASEAIGEKSGIIAIATGVMECDGNYLKDTWLDEGLKAGLYVYFEVADTGCGMDQETTQRIFDPFFSTKFTGRGLGMAAVLGIIRGHHGAIKVYSEVGKGTSIKVLLPGASRPADGPDASKEEAAWHGSGQILLVDDEESVRAVGTMMLQELGYEVLTAVDGREALKLFEAHRQTIRLVLMDLTMPHMGGEEAFRELRRLDPEVKVIISSGYNEQEVAQRFVGKGLAGFLQKPYRINVLREALRDLRVH